MSISISRYFVNIVSTSYRNSTNDIEAALAMMCREAGTELHLSK